MVLKNIYFNKNLEDFKIKNLIDDMRLNNLNR